MEGRVREFYVIDKVEFEALETKRPDESCEISNETVKRAVAPPYNSAVDAVLNRNNVQDDAKQLRTFMESLPKTAAVKYNGDRQRLSLNGVPTKRDALYYLTALTSPDFSIENPTLFYETTQLAQTLKSLRMPTNYIKNTAVINDLVVKNTPPDFDKWAARA